MNDHMQSGTQTIVYMSTIFILLQHLKLNPRTYIMWKHSNRATSGLASSSLKKDCAWVPRWFSQQAASDPLGPSGYGSAAEHPFVHDYTLPESVHS